MFVIIWRLVYRKFENVISVVCVGMRASIQEWSVNVRFNFYHESEVTEEDWDKERDRGTSGSGARMEDDTRGGELLRKTLYDPGRSGGPG